MRAINGRTFGLLGLLFLIGCSGESATQDKAPPEVAAVEGDTLPDRVRADYFFEVDRGFTSVSLNDFQHFDGAESQRGWTEETGVIHHAAAAPDWLISRRPIRDYTIRFEYRDTATPVTERTASLLLMMGLENDQPTGGIAVSLDATHAGRLFSSEETVQIETNNDVSIVQTAATDNDGWTSVAATLTDSELRVTINGRETSRATIKDAPPGRFGLGSPGKGFEIRNLRIQANAGIAATK